MELINLQPLWWLLILAVLAWAFARTLVDRKKNLMWASFLLRVVSVVLIILAMCRPVLLSDTEDVHVIFLVDVSNSIDADEAKAAIDKVAGEVEKFDSGDSWSLGLVGADVITATSQQAKEMLTKWDESLAGDEFRSRSKLAETLLKSRLTFPAGKSRRIILFSDGRSTSGDMAEVAALLKREGTDFRRVILSGLKKPEVSVASVQPNTTKAYSGERIRLRVNVSSNRKTPAVLKISNKSVVVKTLDVKLSPGLNVFDVDVVASSAGANRWTAAIEAEDDHFPLNNKASCRVDVRGKAKVLALHKKPALLRPLAKALARQNIELEIRSKHGLPEDMEKMLEFDAIMLADFPATDMSTRSMENIKKYVRDFGGGLVMTGSDNSFGLGGYYKTPVEDVLPIVSRYEKQKEKASVGMVLVIDKSGSMNGNKIQMAREAAKAAVDMLGPRDRVGVIAFDGSAYVITEMTSASNKIGISGNIDQIAAGGGTSMYPAMVEGKRMLESAGTKVRHMILLTDGQSTGGDFIGITNQMAAMGMTVSSVALGSGAASGLMEQIAKAGNGRFYFTNEPENMPRIFTKETMEASRSAIREEPFLPIKIASSDIIDEFDFKQVPLLLGYVMTKPRPTAKMLLLTETGEPLLAEKRFGLGKSVAFTSDATVKWASEWIDWKGFGKFWAQLLRSCIRKDDSAGLSVSRELRNGKVRLRLQQRDVVGRLLGDCKWTATVIDTDSGQSKAPPVQAIGNGLYELTVEPQADKPLTLRLMDKQNEKMKIIHLHEDYPREYCLDAKMDDAFAMAEDMPASATAELEAVAGRHEIDSWFIIASIICLIGSVLLRRL